MATEEICSCTFTIISNQVIVQKSLFFDGHVSLGGGIGATMKTQQNGEYLGEILCNNTFIIEDSEIEQNSAIDGAGIYIEFWVTAISEKKCPKALVVIKNTTFSRNNTEIAFDFLYDGGAAIHILSGYIISFSEKLSTLVA